MTFWKKMDFTRGAEEVLEVAEVRLSSLPERLPVVSLSRLLPSSLLLSSLLLSSLPFSLGFSSLLLSPPLLVSSLSSLLLLLLE